VPAVEVEGVIIPLPSIDRPGVLVTHVEAPDPPAPVMIGEAVPTEPVHKVDGVYAIVPDPAPSMVTLVVVV
jgi:hypothetical protein